MKKYYYDLHIHSCLSPCGDDDSTPNSIAGMGELNGLQIMALTDHNTCKNCPAFFEACKNHGILPVAGMELTTAEDIHAVCLFPNLEKAMEFDEYITSRRILIPNRVDIFGNQLICDGEDNVIGSDEYLLSNATDISIDEAPKLIEGFKGICFPAHIDRDSNGIIAVLGTFPETPIFTSAEFHDGAKIDDYTEKYSLENKIKIINSDAHFLWDIKEATDFLELEEITNPDKTGESIIKFLREGK